MLTKPLLIVLTSLLLFVQEKPSKTVTPEEQFTAQVAASNVALMAFINLSCDDTKAPTVAKELAAQLDNLKAAYKNLPQDQDPLAQMRDTELFIGFMELTTITVPDKKKSCSKDEQPAPSSQDNQS